jgi:hypothetical protein
MTASHLILCFKPEIESAELSIVSKGATVKVFSNGKEYLIFSTLSSEGSTFRYFDSYLYKISLEELEKMKPPVAVNTLSSYRVAGSGEINLNKSGQWIDRSQDASSATLPLIRPTSPSTYTPEISLLKIRRGCLTAAHL